MSVPLNSNALNDSISFTNEYSLAATINHSGNLDSGHYWAVVRDEKSKTWFSCDDTSVKKVSMNSADSSSAYVLFYVRS